MKEIQEEDSTTHITERESPRGHPSGNEPGRRGSPEEEGEDH